MDFFDLAANQTWFDFKVFSDVPGPDGLSVHAFSGTEAVSTPYEFTIELVSRDGNLDITRMLGKEALLTIADRSGGKRLVHGVIRRMDQLHTGNAFTTYQCELVPRLWFLGQTREHRIYQHQSVVQIIEAVLRKHVFVAGSYAFKLRGKYPEREYCVQYGESDLHFLDRIMEEEGIYYYFTHAEDGHCLCFSDAEGGPPIPGEHVLRFHPGSGNPADTAVVSRLNLRHRINSDAVACREWNFTTPGANLDRRTDEPEWRNAPTPIAMRLETYQFPHLYGNADEGDRYAALQLQRQLTFRQWIDGESDVSRHMPGFTFTLFGHPRPDANRGWWLVSVRHAGKQPGVLEHEAPDGRGLEYASSLTAIPDDTRYVPEQRHAKVRIEGLQSAIVTGPAGEEVYTDRYGRVKVQFHWDRLGNHDETTTCWVRVADAWAGMNFGFIQVPRIGQEVMVEFMEGDPDRPVITGRTYNADLMPPWKLPEQKTLSGIQSREFKAGRRNQLVLDDTRHQIQAQLSSDHGLAQLNLGYITRVDHVEGRGDFRGEGFELRTDDWGAIRAGKGLLVSTDARQDARRHHKDLPEAAAALKGAAGQHEETARLARAHNAQDMERDAEDTARALHAQADDVRGPGDPHKELARPHLVMSSPAGIAMTTPMSTGIHAAEHAAVTSGGNASVSAGRSFLVSALDRVSLFAHKLGMRLFAGRGTMEIQAQSGDMELVADQVLRLISARRSITLTAAEEIVLNAGGSYLRLRASGIDMGTQGKWTVHAASRAARGPDSLRAPLPDLPAETTAFTEQFCLRDEVTGKPMANARYELHFKDGGIVAGITGQDGLIPLNSRLDPAKVTLKFLDVEDTQ
jgi:type VI secretion system secreted protein VgrG